MKIYNVSELNVEAREAILASFEYPVSVKGDPAIKNLEDLYENLVTTLESLNSRV